LRHSTSLITLSTDFSNTYLNIILPTPSLAVLSGSYWL
jgi:hypothetical protein